VKECTTVIGVMRMSKIVFASLRNTEFAFEGHGKTVPSSDPEGGRLVSQISTKKMIE